MTDSGTGKAVVHAVRHDTLHLLLLLLLPSHSSLADCMFQQSTTDPAASSHLGGSALLAIKPAGNNKQQHASGNRIT
jgi:hypothetical protein